MISGVRLREKSRRTVLDIEFEGKRISSENILHIVGQSMSNLLERYLLMGITHCTHNLNVQNDPNERSSNKDV